MRRDETTLMREVDEHLKAVWPEVMREWQDAAKDSKSAGRQIALVTRDCADCGTRVRVGAVISSLSPMRPAGDRAYCAHCRKVTDSPVIEVRGLVVEDDEKDVAADES